jgi:hypothetical protein
MIARLQILRPERTRVTLRRIGRLHGLLGTVARSRKMHLDRVRLALHAADAMRGAAEGLDVDADAAAITGASFGERDGGPA